MDRLLWPDRNRSTNRLRRPSSGISFAPVQLTEENLDFRPPIERVARVSDFLEDEAKEAATWTLVEYTSES